MKEEKELEFNDAPSGYVTLYNYKEPFMEFKGGFGYEGVLLFDGETDKVQCHFCGSWFDYLPAHIGIHGLKASEYKKEVGLRNTSALISESHREKLIANRSISIKNLIKGRKMKESTRKKISETQKENRLKREQQNEKGTCPYQLLDRIQKKTEELGYVPTKHEFGGVKTAIKIFGSWNKAVELAGYKSRKPSQTIANIAKQFEKRYGRIPTESDFKRRLI